MSMRKDKGGNCVPQWPLRFKVQGLGPFWGTGTLIDYDMPCFSLLRLHPLETAAPKQPRQQKDPNSI